MRLDDQWSGTRFPPGGYPYQDERTGMFFPAMEGGLDDRISQVIKHRFANRNLYPEPEYFDRGFVQGQIENYICSRRPEICGGPKLVPPPSIFRIETPKQACTCGATNWKPILCASCGGGRITGYECQSCHAKI